MLLFCANRINELINYTENHINGTNGMKYIFILSAAFNFKRIIKKKKNNGKCNESKSDLLDCTPAK